MKFLQRAPRQVDMLTVVHQSWLLQIPRTWRLIKWIANYRWRWFVLRHIGEGRFVFDVFADSSCLKYKGTLNLFPIKQINVGLSFGPRDKILVPNNMFVIVTDREELQLVAETEMEVKRWLTCICSFCRFPLKSIKSFRAKRKEENPEKIETETATSPPVTPKSRENQKSHYILLKDCYAGKPEKDATDSTTKPEKNAIDSTTKPETLEAEGYRVSQSDARFVKKDQTNCSSKRQLRINISMSSRDLNRPPPKAHTSIINKENFRRTTPDLRFSEYDSPPVPIGLKDIINPSPEQTSSKTSESIPKVSHTTSLISFKESGRNSPEDSSQKIYSSVYETVPQRSRCEDISTIEKITQEAVDFADEPEKAYLSDSGIDSAHSYTTPSNPGYDPFKSRLPINEYEDHLFSMNTEFPFDEDPQTDTFTTSLNNSNKPFTVYHHPMVIEGEDSCIETKSTDDIFIGPQTCPSVCVHPNIRVEVDSVDGPLRNTNNEPPSTGHTEPSTAGSGPDYIYDFPRSYPLTTSNYMNIANRPNVYVNACLGFKTHYDDNSNISEDLPVGSLKGEPQSYLPIFWDSGRNTSPSAIRSSVAPPPLPPRKAPKRSFPSGVHSKFYLQTPPPNRPAVRGPRDERNESISSSSTSISLSSQPSTPHQGFNTPGTRKGFYYCTDLRHSSEEIRERYPDTSEVSYIDLAFLRNDTSPTPGKRYTIYNTVDFMKTRGFNETRKTVEEIYSKF